MITEKKHDLQPVGIWKSLILALLACVAVGIGCFFWGRVASGTNQKLSAVVIQSQLSGISELASVSYSYTNMAQFESSNDFYGMKIPFTTKRFILTYDGVIKAGVNLKDATVRLKGTDVTVKLPKAKILSHTIDEDSVKVFNEKTSIFNPFTVEDFASFQKGQKSEMAQKAVNGGLLTTAQEKARSSVRTLLEASLPENYKLTIQD